MVPPATYAKPALTERPFTSVLHGGLLRIVDLLPMGQA